MNSILQKGPSSSERIHTLNRIGVAAWALVILGAGWPVAAAEFTFDAVAFTVGGFNFYNSTNAWTHPPNWDGDVVPPNDGTADTLIARDWLDALQPDAFGVFVDAPWSIHGLRHVGYPRETNNIDIGGARLTVGDGGITNQTIREVTVFSDLTLSASQTFETRSSIINEFGQFVAGDMYIDGNVDLQNHALTLVAKDDTHIHFRGVISGAGGVRFGTGEHFVSGVAHTYTGGTIINSDANVRLVSDGTFSAATNVFNFGTLRLGLGSRTFGSLSGNGTADIASETLSLGGGDGGFFLDSQGPVFRGVYTGAISGAGGVRKIGGGTMWLRPPSGATSKLTVRRRPPPVANRESTLV